RFLLHGRYTPVKYAPYISFGFVFNDNDIETVHFDARERGINGVTYNGAITVTQKRKMAFRPALGLGYQYTFKCRVSIGAEWTGAIYHKIPTPEIDIGASNTLSANEHNFLKSKITKEFKSSPFNLYHIFHMGIGYTFKY